MNPRSRKMRALLLASNVRKARLRLANPRASIDLREPVYFGPGTHLDLAEDATFIAHERTHFRRNCVVEVNGSGRVEVGEDTQFTYNVVVQCSTSVTIGKRCLVGAAMIVDGNHGYRDLSRSLLQQDYEYRPITIADDVWIGIGAIVMADVGERGVVAANAVVTEPVAPYTVVGGVPARVISEFSPD